MEAGRAAKKLLADHHELAATHWLVMHGRPELTMEHAIALPRWAELFTEGRPRRGGAATHARRKHAAQVEELAGRRAGR